MKEKLIHLAKRLVSRVSGRSEEKAAPKEEISSRAKLQQINARKAAHTQEIIRRVEAQAEDDLAREMQEITTQERKIESLQHWCKDPDRYTRQQVRAADEMGGVGHSFEIDPVKKLPAEHKHVKTNEPDKPRLHANIRPW